MTVDASRLGVDPFWRKLVLYETAAGSPSGWRSEIHDPDFFLAPNGRFDPDGELRATLAAFAAPPAGDRNRDARCRFPARWNWLRARMGAEVPAARQALTCPAYDAFTRSGSVTSISIVYATGYLGNPASYYGHTLLKFNYRDDHGQGRLMDVSVNYGAILGKRDDPVTYIAKSVLGGYDGGFSHNQFYFFDHNYGEEDLRDLWEYRLDLDQDAVDLIVTHAWEVLGKRYTYQFFRRNCAYRMIELVQVADGIDLMPDHWPWIIPQAVVERMGVAQYRGHPILAGVTYLPSRQSRFYAKYARLPAHEAAVLADVVRAPAALGGSGFTDLPEPARQAMLDTLLDYYQFTGNPLERAPQQTQEAYNRALSERYALATGLAPAPVAPPLPPDQGRPLGWVQLGAGHMSGVGEVLSLHVRPAYYDALDAGTGHVRNSALSMVDTRIDVRAGGLSLDRLDLVGVDSANPALSGLPGDGGVAWKVHTGVERQRLSCDHCLVARMQADFGYGHQWPRGLFTAAYLGGAVQSNRRDEGSAFARASVDVIWNDGDRLGARLGYEQRFPSARQRGSYGVGRLETRWAIDAHHDLRLDFQHDDARYLALGLGWYW